MATRGQKPHKSEAMSCNVFVDGFSVQPVFAPMLTAAFTFKQAHVCSAARWRKQASSFLSQLVENQFYVLVY